MAPSPIVVVAAVIVDGDGKVLLQRRATDSHQGNLWEFPGGKLESGETERDGLDRELREELGIEVVSARSFVNVVHDYGDRIIDLRVWWVSEFSGTLRACEGQPLAWSGVEQLSDWPMPAADVPIIRAIRKARLRDHQESHSAR